MTPPCGRIAVEPRGSWCSRVTCRCGLSLPFDLNTMWLYKVLVVPFSRPLLTFQIQFGIYSHKLSDDYSMFRYITEVRQILDNLHHRYGGEWSMTSSYSASSVSTITIISKSNTLSGQLPFPCPGALLTYCMLTTYMLTHAVLLFQSTRFLHIFTYEIAHLTNSSYHPILVIQMIVVLVYIIYVNSVEFFSYVQDKQLHIEELSSL